MSFSARASGAFYLTFCLVSFLVLSSSSARAQGTQQQYLTGHGKDDGVSWDFNCTAGKMAGQWTTIPVPSNWELQGFGKFTYGQDVVGSPPPIVGQYRRTFTVPAAWSNQRVFVVFEGVMTDTDVKINGQSAGPMHQGGYTQFRYEITPLVKFGSANQIDVTVDDESANASVNGAERRGDYWNYAGIYRPVYLEAVPTEFIERTAINAGADGHFAADVFGSGVKQADHVEAQVQSLDGKSVGAAFSAPFSADTQTAHLTSQIASPKLWTAETPNRYQVQVRLMRGATVLHQITQKFGFRTIELRIGDGIYVNGKRILLKGCDRHSFWPDSGRCTSEAVSREDIGLMKDMNMNAVRMSHYPPDQHFLDDCDELGLYVLDELPGWHHFYDTPTGHRIVQEMVTRDVNHPAILFWDNGNEGGFNTALDDDYAQWDPQARHVIHPWANFRGLNTAHYPNFAKMQTLAAGTTVVMPTEFLHGLFDGGAGAGLADYWDVILHSKVTAGGFIWAFLDEAVKRVDLDGHLDTHGDYAPDGIVGPYREKEGSYYTIKAVWTPLAISQSVLPASFTGTLPIENRYDFTNASQCRFTWQLRRFARPNDAKSGFAVVSQGLGMTGSLLPGASGTLTLAGLPRDRSGADALAVRADDPTGHEVWAWVWPLSHLGDFRTVVSAAPVGGRQAVTATETATDIVVRSSGLTATFSKATGLLMAVQRGAQSYSLVNGPRPASGTATLASLDHRADSGDYVLNATYTGDMKSVQWHVRSNGWIQVTYAYQQDGPHDFFGVSFDYPEANVKSMRWLGDGPYHEWQNRTEGGTLNVWGRAYNDTVTGYQLWNYPEFKGYFANVRWLQWQTTEGPLTAVIGQDDLSVQVLTPKFPTTSKSKNVTPAFPIAGLSFLNAIPAMGSKFIKAVDSGPHGQPAVASGVYTGTVSFYFGPLPH